MSTHDIECLKTDIFLKQYDIAFQQHTMSLYPFSGRCTFCGKELSESPEVQTLYNSTLLDHCPYCSNKFIGD